MTSLAGTVCALFILFGLAVGQDISLKIYPTLPPTTASPRRVTAPKVGQNSSICYKYVGCYNTYPPFHNTGGVLPNPPSRIGTVFLLYTPDSKKIGQQVDYADGGKSLSKTKFNPLYPTKFVIHGFTQDEKELWLHDMKDALLTTGPLNVFVVGWGKGASAPDYPKAVANTRVVGKQVAMVIQQLVNKEMELSRIHMIGHSLGAHVSGYAGDIFGGKIGRISGMDPAGPFYENYDTEIRLDPTDAVFVDVIHSNAKPLIEAGAGMFAPCGHIDFYPNGGKMQPGCPSVSSAIWDVLGLKFGSAGDVASCSHSRSHYYFMESITQQQCVFLAHPCSSWEEYEAGNCYTCGENGCSELGYHSIEYAARGKFYLLTKGFTTASAPDGDKFCGLTYDIAITTTTGPQDIKGKISLVIKGSKSTLKTPLQGDGETLKSGLKRIIVDYKDLGDLQELSLTYIKHEGSLWGLFGAGTDQWDMDYVTIFKDSKEYKFCGAKKTLVKTGKTVKLTRCKQ